VRVYLDLCCLKRPFDLQEEPLIRLQTEAVLSILALPSDTVELLQSPALVLENNQPRREAVGLLLSEAVDIPLNESGTDPVHSRRTAWRATMTIDPIVEELDRLRAEQMARLDFDFGAFYRELRAQQGLLARPAVPPPESSPGPRARRTVRPAGRR